MRNFTAWVAVLKCETLAVKLFILVVVSNVWWNLPSTILNVKYKVQPIPFIYYLRKLDMNIGHMARSLREEIFLRLP